MDAAADKKRFKCFDNRVSEQAAREILDGRVYQAFAEIGPIRVIVDIGANIGATAVFFKNMHPEATLYCFEPHRSSFELLVYNTAQLDGVFPYNYGLHEVESRVRLYQGKLDGISNSIIPGHDVSDTYVAVALKSAGEEMRRLQLERIDILKVDTEGCEVPILRNLVKWLGEIKVIYLEYHSELDRLLIDVILRRTHVLYSSRSTNPHRGELTYIRNDLEQRCCYDLIES